MNLQSCLTEQDESKKQHYWNSLYYNRQIPVVNQKLYTELKRVFQGKVVDVQLVVRSDETTHLIVKCTNAQDLELQHSVQSFIQQWLIETVGPIQTARR